MSYFVYILRTSSDTLYIGQTNNLEKRLKEHKNKSTKSATPWELIYFEGGPCNSKYVLRSAKVN